MVGGAAWVFAESLYNRIFTKKKTREDVRKDLLLVLRVSPRYTRETHIGPGPLFDLDEKDTLELFYCIDQGFVDATPGGPGVMKYNITDMGKLELARIMDKQGDK